ncbi:hypothetical protein QBC37DRAFT_12574 [Rhypophila decipiens]|uniref:Uncharacterized protein n=1 Tax=Rhypophila decipiens TaxID=261697 RepID=A0AAN6Y575_9PEZI|nr:hypothetical protein QBC37DRAFT_12574 [Rhypophila decipiens]
MDDPELTQRRERGRMAQRAFRQRQITTIRDLKGKNQELVDAIEHVTRAAARFSRIDSPSSYDRASLDTAIKQARSLGGLPPVRPDDVIRVERDHWLPISNSLGLEPTQPSIPTAKDSDVSSRDSSLPSQTVSVEDMVYQDFQNRTVQNNTRNQSLVTRQYNSNTDSYFTSQETSAPAITTATGGRVSPRLTYGIWFEPDRFIRVINPPSDILPYLGPNINTLAGAIYWAGLGYGFTVLKEVLRMRAQTAAVASSLLQNPGPGSDPLPIVTRLFGHSIKAAGPDADGEQILHDVIHARFTWRKQGYIPGDHPGADPEITRKLFSKVVEDFKTVPFPTPTSKISLQQRQQKSRRNSSDVITNRGVEDLDGQTTSDRTSNLESSTNPEQAPEAVYTVKEDISNWLTPAEIESYVRSRLDAPVPTTFGGNSPEKIDYSTFETAFQSRSSNNNSGPKKRDERLRASMLKRLVRSIADKGVCFGNSPRWRIDVVSAVVDEWMAEVEAAEQAQAAAAMGLHGLGLGVVGLEGGGQRMNTSIINMNTGTMATGFGPINDAIGLDSTTTTGTASSGGASQAAAWYFPSTSASGGYQGHEPHGFVYPYHTDTTIATTTATGFATTTAAATTAAYPGSGSSSSSMYYGSESDGIGAGIPEGMVF